MNERIRIIETIEEQVANKYPILSKINFFLLKKLENYLKDVRIKWNNS